MRRFALTLVVCAAAACGGGGAAPADGGAVPADGGADAPPPTGDGGPVASCIGTKPDGTNTGVPAGVALTVVNGDVRVTEAGAVVDAQDIHGFLTIAASDVTVRRSIVRGRATTSNAGVIRVESGTGILIEDTEVAVAAPSATVDGLWLSNVVARRINVHGGVDGIKAGAGTRIECSYVHDLASFASDPNQGGGATHNDAIQILDGVGIWIAGNQLVAGMDQNAAIQVTQDFGAVGDLHLERNWADGGGCTFNIAHKGADALTGVTSTGNRFGRNSFFDCPILKSTRTTLTSTGDVWDDDGTPVPIQTHD